VIAFYRLMYSDVQVHQILTILTISWRESNLIAFLAIVVKIG